MGGEGRGFEISIHTTFSRSGEDLFLFRLRDNKTYVAGGFILVLMLLIELFSMYSKVVNGPGMISWAEMRRVFSCRDQRLENSICD